MYVIASVIINTAPAENAWQAWLAIVYFVFDARSLPPATERFILAGVEFLQVL